MNSSTGHPTDATLFIAPGCTNCPAVLDGLVRLLKGGKLGRLEIIDVTLKSDMAESAGVRSVPWLRIGPFELMGSQSYSELSLWVESAATGSGMGIYYSHLLETHRLSQVIPLIRESPETLVDLVLLMETLETPMAVRIGKIGRASCRERV